ncbi:phosphate signaling complex protein PhoU [Actinotignum urinale]|uniref:phosphate signaling complex protein PhoU n=1 Tax=Actinotignum urinale TaxID=190146 RepID=UPI002A80EA60|nr:phosphate signaling complex protein PhoU [Actinotignum urinale]MDY5128752.1 phosphate signaling complex protein PhoU [Actinotignum urinale]
MRQEFRNEIKSLNKRLRQQARSAARAMDRAAESLRDSNLALAESVIDADADIDELQRQVEDMAVSLLVRQAPVASDLRLVVTAIRTAGTIERMGDLARHVAYISRGRFPERVGGPGYETLCAMADEATRVGHQVEELVRTQDLEIAEEIEEQDEILDRLHRKSFEIVLDEKNEMTRQECVDLVLLGRFLERFGDHGVSVARRMHFLITGIRAEAELEPPTPGTEEEVLGEPNWEFESDK